MKMCAMRAVSVWNAKRKLRRVRKLLFNGEFGDVLVFVLLNQYPDDSMSDASECALRSLRLHRLNRQVM